MALTFQGVSIADINWGLITGLEVREQGTGSFTSVGRFDGARISMQVLTKQGDPAATEIAYAVRYTVRFNLLQTKAAAEVAMLNAGGLLDTDVEVRATYASGRTITLGAVTSYPLRLVPGLETGEEERAQIIPLAGTNIEPFTAITAKVS